MSFPNLYNFYSYRYGFNGQEHDNEVKGEGNSYDFGARIYDSRLGRFLSIDKYSSKYPYYSSYLFAGNTPIQAIDKNGNEIYFVCGAENNLNFLNAFYAALKLPDASELIYKYWHNPFEDIYITISDQDLKTYQGSFISDVHAITIPKDRVRFELLNNGKIDFNSDKARSSELEREAFKSMQGLDVSKSINMGKSVSLIVIDGVDLMNTQDDYVNSFVIYHEMKSHIDGSEGNDIPKEYNYNERERYEHDKFEGKTRDINGKTINKGINWKERIEQQIQNNRWFENTQPKSKKKK